MAWIDNFIAGTWASSSDRLANIAITVPASAKNTMLLALVGGSSTDTNPERINTIKWPGSGGTSLTDFGDASFDFNNTGEFYMRYLLAPSAGSNNVNFTYVSSKSHGTVALIVLLKNVIQQAPGTVVAANGGGTTRTNSSISVERFNDLVFCQLVTASTTIGARTLGSNQTELNYDTDPTDLGTTVVQSWKRATTLSESTTTNWTNSRDHRMASFAISTYKMGNSLFFVWMEQAQKLLQDLKLGRVPSNQMRQRLEGMQI